MTGPDVMRLSWRVVMSRSDRGSKRRLLAVLDKTNYCSRLYCDIDERALAMRVK